MYFCDYKTDKYIEEVTADLKIAIVEDVDRIIELRKQASVKIEAVLSNHKKASFEVIVHLRHFVSLAECGHLQIHLLLLCSPYHQRVSFDLLHLMEFVFCLPSENSPSYINTFDAVHV
jgi:hypothetical protein